MFRKRGLLTNNFDFTLDRLREYLDGQHVQHRSKRSRKAVNISRGKLDV